MHLGVPGWNSPDFDVSIYIKIHVHTNRLGRMFILSNPVGIVNETEQKHMNIQLFSLPVGSAESVLADNMLIEQNL